MQNSLEWIEKQKNTNIEKKLSYTAAGAKSCKNTIADTNGYTAPQDELKEKKRAKKVTVRIENPKKTE